MRSARPCASTACRCPQAEPTRLVLNPTAIDESGFEVAADPDRPEGSLVRGERPQRWVRQTNFDNAEAVGYLADRLARLGIEDSLAARVPELGARSPSATSPSTGNRPRRLERLRCASAGGGQTGG